MYTDSVGYVSIAINYFIYHMIISLELPLILLGKMSILLGKIGESPIFSNLQFFPAGRWHFFGLISHLLPFPSQRTKFASIS